jgi:hypothetical protein
MLLAAVLRKVLDHERCFAILASLRAAADQLRSPRHI